MSKKKATKKYLSREEDHVSMMIRVPKELRKMTQAAAAKAGVSVNRFVNGLITRAVRAS